MAGSHPYISGAGNISQIVNHLRKAFPATVDSNTVKKLGIASNNESYVINALQFVGVIDEEGKKTKEATTAFSAHKDEDFAKLFGKLVTEAYSDLFGLYGDGTWELSKDDLITYFRKTDDTSAIIGARQAGVFQVFAALSGHGELPAKKENTKPKGDAKAAPAKSKKKASTKLPSLVGATVAEAAPSKSGNRDIGLTVRIELNLPADGTKETYDNIFKSIRANLMDD